MRNTDRNGRPEGTYEASWSEQPIPGIQPGMADHAPTGWVVAGEGPGAEHQGTVFRDLDLLFATLCRLAFLGQRTSYTAF